MIDEIVYSDIMEVYNRLFIDSICFIAVDNIIRNTEMVFRESFYLPRLSGCPEPVG